MQILSIVIGIVLFTVCMVLLYLMRRKLERNHIINEYDDLFFEINLFFDGNIIKTVQLPAIPARGSKWVFNDHTFEEYIIDEVVHFNFGNVVNIHLIEIEIMSENKKEEFKPREIAKKEGEENEGIKERIKTFKDVLGVHFITLEEFLEECLPLTKDEVAYRKIKLIVEALNENWRPDWEDPFQRKVPAILDMSNSGLTSSTVELPFYFRSEDLAKYAVRQFKDTFKDFYLR